MKTVNLTISKNAIENLISQAFTTSEIARQLGIARSTLQWKMKKFNVIPSKFGYLKKDGKTFKRCYKCKVLKEFTKEYFIIRKNGGASQCKECDRIKSFVDSRNFK